MNAHLFVTRRERPVERWITAFPEARVCAFDDLPSSAAGIAIVWVHAESSDTWDADLRLIQEKYAHTPFVVLSNTPEDSQGLAAIGAGASGYCAALAAPDVLRLAAEVIGSGGLWVGESLRKKLMQLAASGRSGTSTGTDPLLRLSEREAAVALAVAEGASNKEIAVRLSITERTVKAHLSAIFEKLGVRDRLQLALLIRDMEPESSHVSA